MPVPKNFETLFPLNDYGASPGDLAHRTFEDSLGMLSPRDPRLSQAAQRVGSAAIGSPYIKGVISRMRTIASGQRGDAQRRSMVGLAAPQIGELVQVMLVDDKVQSGSREYGQLKCFIDPEIVYLSEETEEGREGCFSAGEVRGLVERSLAIGFVAFTPEVPHKKSLFHYEGFAARISQHEIQHFSGIRFPETITNDAKRHFVHAEEQAQYVERIHEWPRTVSLEQWHEYTMPQEAINR